MFSQFQSKTYLFDIKLNKKQNTSNTPEVQSLGKSQTKQIVHGSKTHEQNRNSDKTMNTGNSGTAVTEQASPRVSDREVCIVRSTKDGVRNNRLGTIRLGTAVLGPLNLGPTVLGGLD